MTATIADAARHYGAGDLGEAARDCLKILKDDPAHFDALHLLGVISTNQGRHADGVSYLLRADALRPDDPRLQANLASAYGATQRFDRAVERYRRAIGLGHGDAGVLNNLGLALVGLGQPDDAIATFLAALDIDPAHDPSLYNLAKAQADAGLLVQAEQAFLRLMDRLPSDAPAERPGDTASGLARVLLDQGRPEESLAVLRATAARRPDAASVRWHEALVLLLLGRFDEGWRAYETRFSAPNHEPPHPEYRVLDLHQVAGQRVLVKEEQGRGDVIQFLRYIRPLAALGARVTLSVYNDLLPLALELDDVECVIGTDDDEPPRDVLTSIMSLPLAFLSEGGTIPALVPYLRPPAAPVARMRHHLGPATRPRVGLVWSGSPASKARSAIAASALEPFSRHTGVTFHCLQKEIFADDRAWLERGGFIAVHDTMLRDFGDTAALVAAMDLVVSIDTAVAHLAGALAKPVWIMLPFNPDWRWLLGRDDSPWYPTARLFRQPSPGDWTSVIDAVGRALSQLK